MAQVICPLAAVFCAMAILRWGQSCQAMSPAAPPSVPCSKRRRVSGTSTCGRLCSMSDLLSARQRACKAFGQCVPNAHGGEPACTLTGMHVPWGRAYRSHTCFATALAVCDMLTSTLYLVGTNLFDSLLRRCL